MPTGSGKTLASAKIALERALKGKKKRIIYVIPYNSIIDQTVEEFEKIFGKDMEILRHQSSFSFEEAEDKSEDYREAAKSAVENWDAPFIVTTAVQFFETVHGSKRGKLRKMHNIGAVSYTHLDVYKRQLLSCPTWQEQTDSRVFLCMGCSSGLY